MAPHAHDLGLHHDMAVLAAQVRRRRLLGWLSAAGASAAGLAACGGSGSAGAATDGGTDSAAATAGGSTAGAAAVAGCSVIPEETAGPYPADGSNASSGGTSNAMTLSGIVRSDIRASIAGATGVAAGVPLTLVLRLVDTQSACADLSGYAIYLWHCDRAGNYSLYSPGVTNENYLRGVQPTASDGTATFSTVFPGCYAGRMPHIHFEVYRSTAAATSFASKLKTSQIALPTDVCSAVYAGAAGYAASVANMARIGFATDAVFGDGVSSQLAAVTGSVATGYTATLQVGIASA